MVGCIPEKDGKILLCRRAIEPRAGKWTLPAGYLENGETVAQGAERETNEEAGVNIEIFAPYALFNICHVNQIYLIFRGRLLHNTIKAGSEDASPAFCRRRHSLGSNRIHGDRSNLAAILQGQAERIVSFSHGRYSAADESNCKGLLTDNVSFFYHRRRLQNLFPNPILHFIQRSSCMPLQIKILGRFAKPTLLVWAICLIMPLFSSCGEQRESATDQNVQVQSDSFTFFDLGANSRLSPKSPR